MHHFAIFEKIVWVKGLKIVLLETLIWQLNTFMAASFSRHDIRKLENVSFISQHYSEVFGNHTQLYSPCPKKSHSPP